MRKKETARTTSIARKINRSMVLKQIGMFFWMDVFVLAMIICGWCIAHEMEHFGNVVFWDGVRRYFEWENDLDTLHYVVVRQGFQTLDTGAGGFFIMLFVGTAITTAVQILSVVESMFFQARKIRQKLHPLNEMAKTAEELSSIAFDESKFHRLEDAISQVNPEQGRGYLHIGDKDLEGLELAVNNLIDRMRESYQQQSRFVSDASHELRTPISVIQGYVGMLDRWGKEDENVLEESIAAIKHESEHMSTLVEQLLFLARSDSGRNRMKWEDVDLLELLREVYEESCMIDDRHFYRFREMERKDLDGLHIIGDATMIKQAMRILTDNAVKYTQEGGEILFAAGMENAMDPGAAREEVFFTVQDTGAGMNEKDVSLVFERFYRSEEARSGQVDGSGLGLAIAKWIIDKHKGHFEVLSRPGIGTRIRVVLPGTQK